MSKTAPFFSIVTPSLNEHIAIPKLLEALKNQTFTDFEIVIVDGFSKDGTQEAAEKFASFFNTGRAGFKFKSSKKETVAAQRNVGVQLTRGEYLVFFDADVLIPPDFLQDIYDNIQQTHAELLTTWCVPDSPDPLNNVLSNMMNWFIMAARNSKKPLIPGFNIIMKKSTFEKVGGFDDTVILGEDHDLAQKAAKIGVHVTYLRRPILTYSVRRFKSEGYMSVIKKYIRSTLYIWFKGPIRHQIYEYNMGGEAHTEKKASK